MNRINGTLVFEFDSTYNPSQDMQDMQDIQNTPFGKVIPDMRNMRDTPFGKIVRVSIKETNFEAPFSGDPNYIKAIFEAVKICSQKNADYTANAHPLANFLIAEEFGINPVDGLLIRMLDKIQRIKSYKTQEKLQVENESVVDAFMDLGNYSFLMIALLKYMEENKKEEIPI